MQQDLSGVYDLSVNAVVNTAGCEIRADVFTEHGPGDGEKGVYALVCGRGERGSR